MAFLLESEKVTFSAGVPTLWMTLYTYLETHPHDLSNLRMVPVGGSAMPRQFIEDYLRKYGVRIVCLWGMTETTPVGTFGHLKQGLTPERAAEVRGRHGMPVPGVELRIVDGEGRPLPWDGETMGELQVRGPWVTGRLLQGRGEPRGCPARTVVHGRLVPHGRRGHGGSRRLHPDHGSHQGPGEERRRVDFESVDLENAIMGHPKVMEAAVIAVAHPTWQERPLALVAPHPEYRHSLTKEELLTFLAGKVAKWWLPDEIEFIDAVPKTSVGKFNKKALREKYKSFVAGV